MGSKTEPEQSSKPKLPLLLPLVSTVEYPEHPGMLTPPLHASVSVPFRWEEQPGKPRPCNALSIIPTDLAPKSLELPPRLLLDSLEPSSSSSVLEGCNYMDRPKFQSSSFRFGGECYGSLSPEKGQIGKMVVSKRGIRDIKGKGWFSSWGKRIWKGKKEVSGGSYVHPSSVDRESSTDFGSAKVNIARIKKGNSFSNLSHSRSHFWVSFIFFLLLFSFFFLSCF